MFESKYSKVLTSILVIVIVAIVGLLGFLGYQYYKNYMIATDTSDFVENFQGEITEGDQVGDSQNTSENNSGDETNPFEQLQNNSGSSSGGSGSSSKTRPTYKGFGVYGTMVIPKTNFTYPVLDTMSTTSLETAVVFLYGTGLNQPGNSVIVGHNYRNGLFFSNNKRLNVGDKIYVTDNDGKKMTYTIYSKFEATPEDTSFYQRDTNGKAELTLSTCTDDSSARLIIFARQD